MFNETMKLSNGVVVPQLCIRYDIQLGMIVLPKTANPEHMKSNAEVEFEISSEDMESLKISNISKTMAHMDSSLCSVGRCKRT